MAIMFRIVSLLCFVRFAVAQTPKTINILFVNEEDNTLAEKSFEAAMEYVRQNPSLGFTVKSIIAVGNQSDARAFLDDVCRKYNSMILAERPPHVVLDFTMTEVASEIIKSFTYALSLPTISASFGQEGDLTQWQSLTENQTKFMLQVMPPADIILESIRSFVIRFEMNNAAVLFDDYFVMDHKYKTLLKNTPLRQTISSVKNFTRDEIKKKVINLRAMDFLNYFVVGSLRTINNILNVADEVKYFGLKTQWFAITLDEGDINCTCKDATIIYLRPMPDAKSRAWVEKMKTVYSRNAEPEINFAFYFDLTLRTFLSINALLDSGKWPDDMRYITCDEYDGKNTPNRSLDLKATFEEIDESPTYAPFFIPKDALMNGQSYMEFNTELLAVTLKDGAHIGRKNLGSWKTGLLKPLVLSDSVNISEFRPRLVWRVVTVEQPPFIIRDDDSPKGYKGYCIDLMEEIRQYVKFDYEITLAPDNKPGFMDDDGNWNGIIKELLDKRADVGLASLSIMTERETVVDFTIPYYDLVGITIMMKLPRTTTSLFNFLTVLENNVWWSILASFFFMSFMLWVFDKWSPYSYQNNREKYEDDKEQREFTLRECLWFCITSLTPEGGGEAPKNLAGKLVVAAWWCFGFIITASYTANLAAFLTVSNLDTPIESLDDLSKQYKIQYAPVNGSAAMIYFQRMANIEAKFDKIWQDMSLDDSLSAVERAKLAVWEYPVSDKYTKMWQAMKEAGLPNSIEEAVQRVRDSTEGEAFAWLGDATDVQYQVMTSCDLQVVGEEFSRKPYGLAVQKGALQKVLLDRAIVQLLNQRKLEKLKEKWWSNNSAAVTCEKQDNESDGISIKNIGGVFIVTSVGICLACLILALEHGWYMLRKTSRNFSKVEPFEETEVNQVDPEHNAAIVGEEPIFRAKNTFKPRF